MDLARRVVESISIGSATCFQTSDFRFQISDFRSIVAGTEIEYVQSMYRAIVSRCCKISGEAGI